MTPAGDEAMDVAVEIAARLERLGIPYVVVGALAGILRGVLRTTLDVDFLVAVRPEQVQRLFEALQVDYYVDLDAMHEAAATASSFNAIHQQKFIKADVYFAGPDDFHDERFERRERVQVSDEAALYVDRAEFTVVKKLEWFRRGGEVSERQWRDVAEILRIEGGRLDRSLMRRWAAHLGVTDLLDTLLRDSGLPS